MTSYAANAPPAPLLLMFCAGATCLPWVATWLASVGLLQSDTFLLLVPLDLAAHCNLCFFHSFQR